MAVYELFADEAVFDVRRRGSDGLRSWAACGAWHGFLFFLADAEKKHVWITTPLESLRAISYVLLGGGKRENKSWKELFRGAFGVYGEPREWFGKLASWRLCLLQRRMQEIEMFQKTHDCFCFFLVP